MILRARPPLYLAGTFFGWIGRLDPIFGKGLDEIGGGVDSRRLRDLILLAKTLGKRIHFIRKQLIIGTSLHYVLGAVVPLHFFHLKVYFNQAATG